MEGELDFIEPVVNTRVEGADYKLRKKNFFMTWSNLKTAASDTAESLLEKLKYYLLQMDSTYSIAKAYCIEKHENGVFHAHAVVSYSEPKTITASGRLGFLGQRPRLEAVRNLTATIQYVKKGETFAEEGTFILPTPKRSNVSKMLPTCLDDIKPEVIENRKLHAQFILAQTPEASIDNGIITVGQYNGINKFYNNYKINSVAPERRRDLTVYWIYGPPGCGKSNYVHSQHDAKDLYKKTQTNWWDGYRNQPAVLLDEFDDPQLLHQLKIWMDVYPFTAEVKGSMLTPNYTTFYIVSNHLPQQIWNSKSYSNGCDNQKALEAIMRRINLCTVVGFNTLIPFDPERVSPVEKVIPHEMIHLFFGVELWVCVRKPKMKPKYGVTVPLNEEQQRMLDALP